MTDRTRIDYACSIERHQPPRREPQRLRWALAAAALLLAVLLTVVLP